jgi:hypothetical protein
LIIYSLVALCARRLRVLEAHTALWKQLRVIHNHGVAAMQQPWHQNISLAKTRLRCLRLTREQKSPSRVTRSKRRVQTSRCCIFHAADFNSENLPKAKGAALGSWHQQTVVARSPYVYCSIVPA